jgi:hypothetical protein
VKCRAAVDEAVLDDPLAEILGNEWDLVGQTARRVEARCIRLSK